MDDSEKLRKLRKEIGLESPVFLQRLLFAEWIANGFTLEEMKCMYNCFSTVEVPCMKSLEKWRKQWLNEEFHVKDNRANSDRVRNTIHHRILHTYKRSSQKSARVVARATGYAVSTVCKHLKLHGLNYGAFTKVPHKLTPKMRKRRVEAATEMLNVLEKAEEENFDNIITMDETPIVLENEERKGWYFEGKPKPRVEAESLRKKKFTLTVVWGTCGVACVDGCSGENRIDSKYFCEHILSRSKEWCENQSCAQGVNSFLFHMDNAPCHNSAMTNDYMEENNIRRMGQPPYSPDLSPCDFYLFGCLKHHFAGTTFKCMDDAVLQITQWLNGISKEERIASFQEWKRRLQRCIDLKGDYVFISDKDLTGKVLTENKNALKNNGRKKKK